MNTKAKIKDLQINPDSDTEDLIESMRAQLQLEQEQISGSVAFWNGKSQMGFVLNEEWRNVIKGRGTKENLMVDQVTISNANSMISALDHALADLEHEDQVLTMPESEKGKGKTVSSGKGKAVLSSDEPGTNRHAS